MVPSPEGPSEEVLAALRAPAVRQALVTVFARNRHAEGGSSAPPEVLTEQALLGLAHPDTSGLVDVGGLRLCLTLPDADYDEPREIAVYAWDDDGELWRAIARVPLPAAPGR